MRKENNDNSMTEEDFEENNKDDIYNMLNDKELLYNGVDPLRVSKGRAVREMLDDDDLPNMKLSQKESPPKRNNRRDRRNKNKEKEKETLQKSPHDGSEDGLGESRMESEDVLKKELG